MLLTCSDRVRKPTPPGTASKHKEISKASGKPHGQAFPMAERVGFEPTIRSPVCRISSAVLSTTQPPLRFAGRRFGSAGCLIATKAGAGKRQIQVRRSFFLDSSGALAYAHERSGVEWIPCLFLLRAALRAGVKNPPAEGFAPTAQRLAKRRPPSGRAGTNMKG